MTKSSAEKVYRVPSTDRSEVCLESAICAASKDPVVMSNNNSVNIENQDYAGSFDNFSTTDWSLPN